MAFNANRDQDQRHLYKELVDISEPEFSRVFETYTRGNARSQFGNFVADLLTQELLQAVVNERRAREEIQRQRGMAMRPLDPNAKYNYGAAVQGVAWDVVRDNALSRRPPEWDVARDQPRGFAQADSSESIRERQQERIYALEQQLRKANDRAETAESNLAGLRETFVSLFGADAAEDNLTVLPAPVTDPLADPSAGGSDVRSWRVRIYVPAFTVETTMQELVMAREQQEAVAKWIHNYSRVGMISADARPHISKMIASRILDSENKMESLEPEAVQNPENEK